MHAVDDAGELFGTETMAELCARQGRLEDARAIYRRLCARGAGDERHARWVARLGALEAQALAPGGAAVGPPRAAETAPPAREAPAAARHALPLVVRQPVRAGQIVYAE